MSEVFNDKLKAAEDEIFRRRGKKPSPKRERERVDMGGSLDMLEVKRHISAAAKQTKGDLERSFDAKIEDALASVRQTEIVYKSPNKVKTLQGKNHYLFETLVRLSSMRDPIFLSGPAGSGKSTAAKKLADLLDLPFSYTGQTNMPHKVEGNRDPVDKTFYRHTKFTETFINGGVHIFEEVDAWNPNASLVINPPLANKWLTLEDGSQYEQHKDAIFIAAANTWGNGATADYVGRNKLDAAFLDRFSAKLHWGYDHDLEIAVCGDVNVAKAVQMARYNADRYKIKVVISPRSSIAVAKMMELGFTMEEAFDMNFLASVDNNTRKKLLEDVDLT